MSQETAAKPMAEMSAHMEKKAVSVQELVDSLRSISDDIGQISELTSEERILVAQFFTSLLKLMQPLATSIAVSPAALPPEVGLVNQASIDPTGHLALTFKDGHTELKDLSDDQNRDLMIVVIEDALPKFKTLTSNKKRKLEARIKFLTTVTKEIQKISDALNAVITKKNEQQ